MPLDAIVIGTGLGGSVAAAVLAAEGLEVLVLEKNPRVGGVCSWYEKDGFRVDVGTHMFSRGGRGPLGSLARRLGIPPIPFVQPPHLTLVRFMGAELVVPRDLHRYPAFVVEAARALKLGPRDIANATRFFADVMRFDEARLAELDRVTMLDFITRYTRNPLLVGAFGLLLGLYFILPLREVSAGEGVWCFRRMVADRGLSYPRGGAHVVPAAFLEAARARGASVLTRREVVRIVVERGEVRGVACKDGSSYEAPVVVGTASLKDHVERLVGPAHFPSSYVERIRSIKSSLIAVQAKIALRRPLVDAGALVGAWTDSLDVEKLDIEDLDRMYGEVLNGRIAPITPIYAPIPTNFDPTLGPPGRQLITACAVAPTTDVALVEGSSRWTENLMATMNRLVPGLDGELLWVDTWSTRAIGRWMGKVNAPAVSTGQTPDQVGNRRPPVHTPVRGLYVCGCGAGGRGVGTELAAASGAEAADRVVQDLANGLIARRRAAAMPARRARASRAERATAAG